MADTLIRVLYIDDDVALVRLVTKTLGRRGFEIVHAASVADGLAQLGGGGFDAIALDHYLSDATGLDVLPRIAATVNPTPPVVYVTGSSEMNVAVAALKAGAADFVPKTVGGDFTILLATALEQAVEKAVLRAEKEAAEQEVRQARDRAEALLAEVNHRVANSLALVSSLVSLQANAVSDPAAREALGETHARIYAISLIHRRLYTSGDVRGVELDEYLGGLLEHLQTSMRGEGHDATLVATLEPVRLPTDTAINLGVVLTEWVTNAFKYAYPGASGDIRVTLRRLPQGKAELSVEDDGVGRVPGAPIKGTGLGTRIVKAMAQSMTAEIAYDDLTPGMAARLIFPANESVQSAATTPTPY